MWLIYNFNRKNPRSISGLQNVNFFFFIVLNLLVSLVFSGSLSFSSYFSSGHWECDWISWSPALLQAAVNDYSQGKFLLKVV